MVQSRKRMNRKQKGGGNARWGPGEEAIYDAAYNKYIKRHEDKCVGDLDMDEALCKSMYDTYANDAGDDAVKEARKKAAAEAAAEPAAEKPAAEAEGGKRRTRKAKKSNKQRKTKGGKKTAKKGKKSYKKKSTRRRH